MSRRAASRLAWSLFALTLALLAVGLAFEIADRGVARDDEDSIIVGLLFSAEALAWAFVGAIVATRHRRNPIGWMFCAFGVIGGVASTADGYAAHGLLADPGSLPGSRTAAWLADFVISSPAIFFGFVLFLLFLFPHGRLPSPRWRPAAAATVFALVLLQAFTVLERGPLPGFPSVENPFGVAATERVGFLFNALFFALLVAVVAATVRLVRRFRRARGEERQQLKWAVAAIAFLAAAVVSGPVWWFAVPERISDYAWPVLFALSLASVPLACGMAILRYRLYDVDVVINRALVYGTLTGALGGTYLALVLVLQVLSEPVTQGSDLAIAGSTLAVAALFRPLRNRIQAAVDRRFYRRRYDAQRTLAAFSARLREEVDLEALSVEVNRVVRETVQPSHVSLWLREAGR
jgi:hypothetical protein